MPGANGSMGCVRSNDLDLALFVHAQHHRLEWRIQVQSNDIANLVDEQRIAREFEGLLPMRLKAAEGRFNLRSFGRSLSNPTRSFGLLPVMTRSEGIVLKIYGPPLFATLMLTL
jgi:hypothetical protein